MSKRAFRDDQELSGWSTFVTQKSKEGLPTDISRERETNLPPGSATTNSPRQEDTADGNGRHLGSPSYNVPDGESNVSEHPRTLPTPGDLAGSPTKFDYGMVTRRSLQAYKARQPWRRQRRQPIWKRLKDKQKYRFNKPDANRKSKLWYKRVKRNNRFQTLRERRRENPKKYERRRVGEENVANTIVEAYHPMSPGHHRHRQHGPARQKSHRQYIRNRARANRQHRIWYQRNKNKPAFKRRQKLRRLHPNQYRLRHAGYVPPVEIGFMFGPDMTPGRVEAVTPDAVTFSPVPDPDLVTYVLSPAAFLHAVVFDSLESKDAMFTVLDQQVGLEAYDDLTQEDLSAIAALYEVALPDAYYTDPDVLLSLARAIVEEAMEAWDDPSESAVRVAARYLLALGDVVLYDQESPGQWEKPDTKEVKRDGPGQWRPDPGAETHTPTPGGMPHVDVPNSGGSGKVIPDSMKTAATIAEIERNVAADVSKRARGVKVRLSRADPKRGMWTFSAAGSEGKTYTIRVQAAAKGNTKDVSKLEVKVSCDCDFFRYQGPEHWARTNDYLYGKPRGAATAPTEKDPHGKHWLCKHAAKVLFDYAKKYRVASDDEFWWPADATFVPVFGQD